MAELCRVTCGWKKPQLSLEHVRPYWRDVHSPAIARRAGIWEYRHYPLDPIRADLFRNLPGIDFAGKPDEQLMWLSDVRYRDEAGLAAFGNSPGPAERAQILADIEMIVDKSTTYKVLGENGRTLVDETGNGAPAGPARWPMFEVFLRSRGEEKNFRTTVREVAQRWSRTAGVLRLRMSLFERPDMEAERAAGYPIKTHPPEMQYQAWIDLVIEHESVADALITADDSGLAGEIAAIHAYPAPAVYTFNYGGHPTIAGLRGYAAHVAIESLNATHQKNPALLEWMYGPIARGVTP